MCRFISLLALVGSLLNSALNVRAASGVTEIPLTANALLYDSFTDKLYAAATNNLLQLDPLTGQILNSFFLGTNITLLAAGAGNGIWAALDGEHAVRRFHLATLSAEDKVVLPDLPRGIFDLYGSLTDPNLAVVSIRDRVNVGTAFIVRNGSVLPASRYFTDFVALQGVSVYGTYSFGDINASYRMALGASGIGAVLTSTSVSGPLRPFGPYIYYQDGSVRDAISLAVVGDLGGAGSITINQTENTVYQLASLNPILSVFSHPSLQKISSVDLTSVAANGIRWLAGYRRHAAFLSQSKLVIVDLDQLSGSAPSANLEVIQSAPGPVVFGSPLYNFTVTIINHGPNAAVATATDTISSGFANVAAFCPDGSYDCTYGPEPDGVGVFNAASPLVREIGSFFPGSTFSYSLTILPGGPGPITNTVTLTSTTTQPTQTVSRRVIEVLPQKGPITAISNAFPQTLAYDSRSGKLFASSKRVFYIFRGGRDNVPVYKYDISVIDPQAPAILPSIPASAPALVRTPASGGALFVQSTDGTPIQRIDTVDFSSQNFVANSPALIDLLVSPTDTHLIAEVNATGTQLIRDGVILPKTTTATGPAQFSTDGSKLYLINAADCVLNIFNIDQNGLTLAQTRTNSSCSTFTEADGLLYFDGGTIYDPVTDKRTSVALSPPVLMLARGNSVLDTLARSNGLWTVRRLSGPDHHVVRALPLIMLEPSDGIFQFTPAGPDRVALLAGADPVNFPGSKLYIVNLGAPSELTLSISDQDPATLTLQFDSANGATYRIETKSDLLASNWTIVQDNIPGTGSAIEMPISFVPQRTAFFRVFRQSQ
jgi:hypothetical protein